VAAGGEIAERRRRKGWLFSAARSDAIGPKRQILCRNKMSAYGGKPCGQLLILSLSPNPDLVEFGQRSFKFVIEEPYRSKNFEEGCRFFCSVSFDNQKRHREKSLPTFALQIIIASLPAAASESGCRRRSHPDCPATQCTAA
jgi:hypothetical protein